MGRQILRPCEGTALYRTEGGAAVLVIHYRADKAKREPRWAKEAALDYPDGMRSIDWRQEYEIDFDAEIGKLTYYAFNPVWNVVPEAQVDVNWPWWLAFDFGETTCCLFFAQHPATRQIVVFDEGYWVREPGGVQQMRADIHEKLCRHRGVGMGELRADDILDDAVGDPSAPGLAREFGFEPYPVTIRTKGHKTTWKLNDVRLGESRVNEYFTPGIWCCGRRQFAPEPGDVPCVRCKRVQRAEPLLVIMDGRAPNLVRCLPEIVRMPAPADGLEAPERDMEGLEDHAPDTLRYGVMRVLMEVPEERSDDALLRTPSRFLRPEQLLEKIRRKLGRECERERQLSLDERRALGMVFLGRLDDGSPVYTDADEGSITVFDEEEAAEEEEVEP